MNIYSNEDMKSLILDMKKACDTYRELAQEAEQRKDYDKVLHWNTRLSEVEASVLMLLPCIED
ncbi:hypothetical protein_gp127 [Bacillus phage vB_BceM_WH1]|nr:hypothetical protein_gp127 [Bacillus phage vB_BceM_WH1]